MLFPRRSLSSAILAAGFDVEMTLAPTRVKDWKHDQYMNSEPATGFERGTVFGSGECHWSAEKAPFPPGVREGGKRSELGKRSGEPDRGLSLDTETTHSSVSMVQRP